MRNFYSNYRLCYILEGNGNQTAWWKVQATMLTDQTYPLQIISQCWSVKRQFLSLEKLKRRTQFFCNWRWKAVLSTQIGTYSEEDMQKIKYLAVADQIWEAEGNMTLWPAVGPAPGPSNAAIPIFMDPHWEVLGTEKTPTPWECQPHTTLV